MWEQVHEVARRFAQMPRSGDLTFGFVGGPYPTDAPTSRRPSVTQRTTRPIRTVGTMEAGLAMADKPGSAWRSRDRSRGTFSLYTVP